MFHFKNSWGNWSVLIMLLGFLLSACGSDSSNTNTPESKPTTTSTKEETQMVNDWKLSALRGQVKEVIEKTYRSAASAMADAPVSVTQTRFFENGNIQEMLTVMDNGSKRSYTYRYTPDSIFVNNWLLKNDTVIERQQFIYLRNEQGARTKMMLPAAQGQLPNYYADIRNNAAGLPTEYHHHLKNPEDRLQMPCKEIRKYDEHNYLISEQMYRYNPVDSSCTPTNTIRYYNNDEQGNCIEERIVKNGKQILSEQRYTYRYDAKGNWIEKNRYTKIGDREEITLVVLRTFEFY